MASHATLEPLLRAREETHLSASENTLRSPRAADPADVIYAPASDSAGMQLSVSVFADRADIRLQWREDAEKAGFAIREFGAVADLLSEDAPQPLGDVVLLDCPQIAPAHLAALSRLDMRVARSGAQLLVATSMEALDSVFGCLDQSGPEILVNSTRGERVIALGRVLARIPNMRLKEMSEDDRLMLLRLTEQVGQIADRLEKFGAPAKDELEYDTGDNGRVNSPALAFNGFDSAAPALVRQAPAALPDPRLVRRIIRQRQLRKRFFEDEIFSDPAWDMLLDLTAAKAENARVCVTSLCIASGVPPTTALRWITQMVDAGLFERVEDDRDKRRAFIQLSEKAADAMARYFAELRRDAVALA